MSGRDNLNFLIVNFPFLSSNIHTAFAFHGESILLEPALSFRTLLNEEDCSL